MLVVPNGTEMLRLMFLTLLWQCVLSCLVGTIMGCLYLLNIFYAARYRRLRGSYSSDDDSESIYLGSLFESS